ncbi:MAG: AMP-binding protein, partial [Gemmatimonadaceae bacterium]
VETCENLVDKLRAIGVDDIACLIDFGVDSSLVLAHLAKLRELRERVIARENVETIPQLVARHSVTHLQCTPSMATMLLASDDAAAALAPLTTLLIGGEAFPQLLAERIRAVTNARLMNMYGPTETTIWSTTHDVQADDESVPIGRPIANTHLYIVDANHRPVPVGVAGELLIGGAGVVRGYLDRPELTAERFVDVGIVDGPIERVYRTGDLARYRSDGTVEFVGRIDHQVKIRGFRIELGEIETAIARDPSVNEAVVVAREDTPGDKRLVAYIVPVAGGSVDADSLRASLRDSLPEYMVPGAFVSLAQIPRTPNAKIDRNALPAPFAAVPLSIGSAAPEAGLEQTIAEIWMDVLKVPKVGTGDNFFDLGGHSLLAVQVHGRLKNVVRRDVSITDLFRFPTIRALAGYLSTDGPDDSAVVKGRGRAEARRQSMTRKTQRQ